MKTIVIGVDGSHAIVRVTLPLCRSFVGAWLRGDSYLYPSAVTTLVRDYVERGGHGEEQFDVLTPTRVRGAQADRRGTPQRRSRARSSAAPRPSSATRQNVLDTLGMRDRVELTRYAIRRGLIQR